MNSSYLDTIDFKKNKIFTIRLPKEKVIIGTNIISFEFKRLFKIKITKNEHYLIGKTGVYSPVDIRAKSISEQMHFEGKIILSPLKVGREKRLLSKKGYNIFVVDEKSGKIIDSQSFNTSLSKDESARMAEFLKSVEKGKAVIALVQMNASSNLSDKAVEALKTIGAKEDIRTKMGYGHVIIGVKGSEPGEALEEFKQNMAVLEVGQFSNSKNVASWFNKVEIKEQIK